ncbi:MAG: hypothetical protein VYE22_11805 [Myxococcota bacterium]|nr:hypothetical protein [Myxococcota bacterium]
MALFALPFVILASPFELAMWRAGESWPAARALDAQREAAARGEELLWGRRFFSQQFNVYKLEGIARARADVLVVGSSRVMQLRAEHFEPVSFYNAGGLLQGHADLMSLLGKLADGTVTRPEVLVIGVDPWWFTRGAPGPSSWLEPASLTDAAFDPSAHVAALLAVPGDSGPLLEALRGPSDEARGIGLHARGGSGFRVDGSRRYGGWLQQFACDPVYRDREDPPVVERVARSSRQFAVDGGFDAVRWRAATEAMRALEGTHVVLFVPPLSTEVRAAIEASPEHLRWWSAYLDAARGTRGVQVVVAETPATYGLDDRYMLDGFHPSEVLLGRVVEAMREGAPDGSLLGRVDAGWSRAEGVAAAWSPLGYRRPHDLRPCGAE